MSAKERPPCGAAHSAQRRFSVPAREPTPTPYHIESQQKAIWQNVGIIRSYSHTPIRPARGVLRRDKRTAPPCHHRRVLAQARKQ